MGYSIWEWFDDTVKKQMNLPDDFEFEKFKQILTDSIHGFGHDSRGSHWARRMLIDVILGPEFSGNMNEFIRNMVEAYNDGIMVKTFEYADGVDTVTIKFNGEVEDEK